MGMLKACTPPQQAASSMVTACSLPHAPRSTWQERLAAKCNEQLRVTCAHRDFPIVKWYGQVP